MRNKVAKKLRKVAETETIGLLKSLTRKRYKQLKKVHKSLNHTQK